MDSRWQRMARVCDRAARAQWRAARALEREVLELEAARASAQEAWAGWLSLLPLPAAGGEVSLVQPWAERERELASEVAAARGEAAAAAREARLWDGRRVLAARRVEAARAQRASRVRRLEQDASEAVWAHRFAREGGMA